MTRKSSYLLEASLGLLITAAISIAYVKKTPAVETANLKTFDILSKFRKHTPVADSIQIVEIDDTAVANLGRWPWPRALVAQLLDDVAAGGAKVIGLNVLFTEEDRGTGLEEIAQLRAGYNNLLKKHKSVFRKKNISLSDFEDFQNEMEQTEETLNGDAILERSIAEAANVVLPMYFQPGDPKGNNLDKLPEFFDKQKLAAGVSGANVPTTVASVAPLERFGKAGIAIGHSNLSPDIDGSVRRMTPLMKYGEAVFPSFGLEIVRVYKDLQKGAFASDKNGLSLFNLKIPTDKNGDAMLDLAGAVNAFKRHSAVDVLTNALPEKSLQGKIVLIGVSAAGLAQAQAFMTPTGQTMTGLEIWAAHIENILNQHFVTRPAWAPKAEMASLVLAAMIIILVLPLVRARFAIPVFFAVLVAMLGGSAFYLIKQAVWISPAYAMVLMAAGFAVIVGRRLMFVEKGKELVEAEGMETNKMLGLSFQGQGMLDLAFEKFRKCPVDESIKELLYNLGLDMERKRQFTKAAAVYEHIATADSGYKDIQSKIELLKKAGEGAIFGSIGKKGSEATVLVEGLKQSTTLGRYEVIKELGRGAMGVVYLGKDPKINRQVAIKTLRFEDNMDDDQIKSVKERFFREAESAGNLTHPNIISIFDAGEDQEVAYIAMELLEGEDLKRYCEKTQLLQLDRALDMMGQVASGLDYAHKQGVVHRDIKPGNIMLLKDGTLRITDFGIARIQATSRTATGAVLGTPAYMSPEQVNGKKVDGRADIFSLGVTLFELVTGEKPFAADSIAALLYRIANVEHPDPREFSPNLPAEIIPIINKALAKTPEQRYQTAGEMATDIAEARKKIQARPAVTATPLTGTAPIAPMTPSKPAAPVATPVAPPIAPPIPPPVAPAAAPGLPPTIKPVLPPNAGQTLIQTMADIPRKEVKPADIEHTVRIEPPPTKDIPLLKGIDKGYSPEADNGTMATGTDGPK